MGSDGKLVNRYTNENGSRWFTEESKESIPRSRIVRFYDLRASLLLSGLFYLYSFRFEGSFWVGPGFVDQPSLCENCCYFIKHCLISLVKQTLLKLRVFKIWTSEIYQAVMFRRFQHGRGGYEQLSRPTRTMNQQVEVLSLTCEYQVKFVSHLKLSLPLKSTH